MTEEMWGTLFAYGERITSHLSPNENFLFFLFWPEVVCVAVFGQYCALLSFSPHCTTIKTTALSLIMVNLCMKYKVQHYSCFRGSRVFLGRKQWLHGVFAGSLATTPYRWGIGIHYNTVQYLYLFCKLVKFAWSNSPKLNLNQSINCLVII